MAPVMCLGVSIYEATLHGDETQVLPAIDDWRVLTGFYPSILPLWSPFDRDLPAPRGSGFPADWLLRGLRMRGIEPAIFAHSASGANWQAHGYEAVLAGDRDEALEQWGLAAAAYGHRLLLRWDQEMNGGFPWSKRDPDEYVAVFRHVSQRIRDVAGAHNVELGFCPSLRKNVAGLDPIESYYPGDGWCQFVGFDGYSRTETWEPLAEQWGPLLEPLRQMSAQPIVVGEFGRRIDLPQRAAWLASLRDVQDVSAVIYFDMDLTHFKEPAQHWRMNRAMREVYRKEPSMLRSPRRAWRDGAWRRAKRDADGHAQPDPRGVGGVVLLDRDQPWHGQPEVVDESIEFVQRRRIERRKRPARGRLVDGTTLLVDELAQRQVQPRLVLVTDEWQVAIERVTRLVCSTSAKVAVDRDEDLGEAEASHHADGSALQLLEHEVAAQAAEDPDLRVGLQDGRNLLGRGIVLQLEPAAGRDVSGQTANEIGAHEDARPRREVLYDDGRIDRSGEGLVVTPHGCLVGSSQAGRRDKQASRAAGDGITGEGHTRVCGGRGGSDDDRYPAGRGFDADVDDGGTLCLGELAGLSEEAEDG